MVASAGWLRTLGRTSAGLGLVTGVTTTGTLIATATSAAALSPGHANDSPWFAYCKLYRKSHWNGSSGNNLSIQVCVSSLGADNRGGFQWYDYLNTVDPGCIGGCRIYANHTLNHNGGRVTPEQCTGGGSWCDYYSSGAAWRYTPTVTSAQQKGNDICDVLRAQSFYQSQYQIDHVPPRNSWNDGYYSEWTECVSPA